jgi:hypothetical protein
VGVISPPPPLAGTVATDLNRSGPAAEAVGGVFGGPLGPLGLMFAPFALASDAVQCNQKLDAAYPDISRRFPEIAQREFSPTDVQDQFVSVLQESTSAPIAREEIIFTDDESLGEQKMIAAAAAHGHAHLFLVEIASVALQSSGKGVDKECDTWHVLPRMTVRLWRVADRKLVLSFSPGYRSPFATGALSDARLVFDEPGALRSRLRPTYDTAARMFSARAMFQLPP